MICFPNAKINLGLFIIGKRSDGYHNLNTIFYPVPLKDILEIIPSPDHQFYFETGGIPIPGSGQDNLCVRVFHYFRKQFGIPAVKMYLYKNIPAGSGLGGGSSDAAFAIMLLNKIFHLNLSRTQMQKIAAETGSDCPFFIRNQPSLATGRGERLKPVSLNLSGFEIVIVKPDICVSTAYAYSLIKTFRKQKFPAQILTQPVELWKEVLINDFEEPLFRQFPQLDEIKQTLYKSGALYASLSGSGSAVYGIFRNKPGAGIKKIFPDYFVWEGKFD